MPSSALLVTGDANPNVSPASGFAGDEPRVNSGGIDLFDQGFDLPMEAADAAARRRPEPTPPLRTSPLACLPLRCVVPVDHPDPQCPVPTPRYEHAPLSSSCLPHARAARARCRSATPLAGPPHADRTRLLRAPSRYSLARAHTLTPLRPPRSPRPGAIPSAGPLAFVGTPAPHGPCGRPAPHRARSPLPRALLRRRAPRLASAGTAAPPAHGLAAARPYTAGCRSFPPRCAPAALARAPPRSWPLPWFPFPHAHTPARVAVDPARPQLLLPCSAYAAAPPLASLSSASASSPRSAQSPGRAVGTTPPAPSVASVRVRGAHTR
nr:translation initiation factor IF-2-like [Aegilops tauschii subsp. strangulata]